MASQPDQTRPLPDAKPSQEAHASHFHFPPVSIHNLKHKMEAHSHWPRKHQHPPPAFCPETDIRETKLAYHIEIDVAGSSDKERFIIQWMSPRTLVVQGELERPVVGFGKDAQGDSLWEGRDSDGWATESRNPPDDASQGACLQCQPSIDEADVPTFILSERKVGVFQRSFTLPRGVDMQGLKARLVDGLLRIDLPKHSSEPDSFIKIQVE